MSRMQSFDWHRARMAHPRRRSTRFSSSGKFSPGKIACSYRHRRLRVEPLEERRMLSLSTHALLPLGSLVYTEAIEDSISVASETDSFTMDLDPGQTITVLVEPEAELQPVIELFDPANTSLGTASSAAAGQDAVLQPVATTGAGTYTVTVGGAAGTLGNYSAQVILNAAVEDEQHDGPTNDSIAEAQDLSASFLSLGHGTSERSAELGRGDDRDSGALSQTQNNNVFYPNVLTFDFSGAPTPLGDGVLTVSTISDLGSSSEYLTLAAEGLLTQNLFVTDGGEQSFASTTVNLTQAQLATLFADDGVITFTVTPSSSVDNLGPNYLTLELSYPTAPPTTDFYSFSLLAGQSASLALASQDGGSVALELQDATGSVLATGIAAGNVDQVINNFVSTVNGTYYANVIAGTSEYSLVVTRDADFDSEPNDDPAADAQEISLSGVVLGALMGSNRITNETEPNDDGVPGGSITDLPWANDWSGSFLPIGGDDYQAVLNGSISAGNDVDWDFFKILAAPGDSLELDLRGAPSGAGTLGDPYLRLYDNTGTQIASNDDSIGLESHLVFNQFTVAGDYYVVADSYSSSTGSYELTATLTTSNPLSTPDTDFYTFEANAGDLLTIEATIPAAGPGEFVNDLDVSIELLDPEGTVVASTSNPSSAPLAHTALLTGAYTVRLFTDNAAPGEYLLEVNGHSGSLPLFEVIASVPENGAAFAEHSRPAQMTIDLSSSVLATSVEAADLTVDGTPATGVTFVDDDTLVFDLPVLTEGIHNATIAAGALTSLQNAALEAFSTQFTFDFTAPRIINSSIQDGDIVSAGPLVYMVQFDEELDAANLDAADVQLVGLLSGSYSPTLFNYDSVTSTLTVQYENLPEEQYALRLISGDGALEDLVGNDLDGEPLAFPVPPNTSGDGVVGGDFVVNFTTDFITAPYPVPLAPKNPLGSLIYDPSQSGVIGIAADTDSFILDLDEGQTISVVVETDSSLQAAVQLFNPGNFLIGSATAGAVGQDAVIQAVPTTGAGTYQVAMGSVAGTTGTYSVQVILNAAVETEAHDGLPNNTRLTAQNLNPSFLSLGHGTSERSAELGRGDDRDSGALSQTQNNNVFYPNVLTFDFSGAPTPLGDGVLTVSTISDLGSSSEYLTLAAEGLLTQNLFVTDGGEQSFASTTVNLTQAQLATLFADDGVITFTVTPSSSVDNLGPNYLTLELSYPTAPPTTDFYSFSLLAGQSASLALASQDGGSVALELQDATGSVLATGIAAGNVDQVINNFVSTVNGTYYANVIAGTSEYSLVVTRDADFDTESNDDLDSAQVLGPNLTALGYLSGEAPSGPLDGGPSPSPAGIGEFDSLPAKSGLPDISDPNRLIVRFGDLGGMTMLEKIASMGGSLLRELPLIHGAVIELSTAALGVAAIALGEGAEPKFDSSQLSQIADAWETDESIIYAEPDYTFQITETFPNDPDFAALWGMHNTGQTGGTLDADIDAPEAWDTFTGSTNVVIASIDSGVDYNHPDLAPNMWQNLAELGGTPGVDDDGNGYVDDIFGIDTANNDSDPFDDAGHGTHTSGTFGAVGNNGVGVAGVNWDVQIMALKFLDQFGFGFTSDAIELIEYMTTMKTDYGVNVVASNNSWGGDDFSQALRDAIQASNDAGIMFVASAGNDGVDADINPSYPAAYDLDGIISVAATDHNDQLASFPTWGSNYGATSVDLGAPGVDTWSTIPGNSYSFSSGTSMAAPHVAGTVAMLMASDPNASLAEVKAAILSSADPIPALDGNVVSGGRLNLANALAALGDPGDYYQFEVQALDQLILSTSTPAGGLFEFVNALDPVIELYDPTGLLVGGADERNAFLAHTASASGTYTARVVSNSGRGEYILNIQGATGGLETFAVSATDPADGAFLPFSPTQILVDFNDGILLTSLDASDLTVDGAAASGYSIIDQNTVAFDLATGITDGLHHVALAAGAILDLQATPLDAYAGTFHVDTVGPRILSTQWNGQPMLASGIYQEGPLTFAAIFDEDLFLAGSSSSPETDDVLLVDHISGTTYTPLSVDYDSATDLLEATFQSLPEGDYELTLISGDGGLEDQAGNDLDGEPLGPGFDGTVTGDGVPGGDYTVSFGVDRISNELEPWIAREPLGSLMFASRDNTGLVNASGDQDLFQFFLEGGQKLTAELTPHSPTALLSLELLGLTTTMTAPGAGEAVVLPLTDIPAAALFELRVSGDTKSGYELDLYRNAAVEAAVTDTDAGNPLALDSSLLALDGPLSSGRYGVVGRSDAVPGSAPPIAVETEPNDDGVRGGSIDDLPWANDWSGSFEIAGRTRYQAVLTGSISAGNDQDWDFFKILAGPGDSLELDLRGASSGVGTLGDPYLRLYDNTGTQIASDDDSGIGFYESHLVYNNFTVAGDYYVVADSFGSWTGSYELTGTLTTRNPLWTGSGNPDTDFYTLDLSGQAGQRLDVILSGEDGTDFTTSTLELLDDAGNVLATAASDPLGSGGPAGNFDLGILDLAIPDAGSSHYTLRFDTEQPGEYGIVVTDALVFDTEPNNEPSVPLRNLDEVSSALGFLDIESIPPSGLVEPDDFLPGTILNQEISGVTLSVLDSTLEVTATTSFYAPTGTLAFGRGGLDYWGSGSGEVLQANFSDLVDLVSIVVGSDDSSDISFLRAFDSNDLLLQEVVSSSLSTGQTETLTITRPTDEIAYITAGGVGGDLTFLDRLEFNSTVATPLSGDAYQVDLLTGQNLHVFTETLLDHPLSTPTGDLNPSLTILDPNGQIVAFDSDSWDGKNAELHFTASAGGTYAIQVQAESGTGTYLLNSSKGAMPADFNVDHDIDGFDFLAWQRGFGMTSGAATADGDANGDGAVDGLDQDRWQEGFGAIQSEETTTPLATNFASGDFDGNLDSDGTDFLLWQRGYGITTGATADAGDANRNGAVDGEDLVSWEARFGIAPQVESSAPNQPILFTLMEPISSSDSKPTIRLGVNRLTEPVTFGAQSASLPRPADFWSTFEPIPLEFNGEQLHAQASAQPGADTAWLSQGGVSGITRNLVDQTGANRTAEGYSNISTESFGELQDAESNDLALAHQDDWRFVLG